MVVDATPTLDVGVERRNVLWRACLVCDEFGPLPPGLDECQDCSPDAYVPTLTGVWVVGGIPRSARGR